MKNWFTIHDPHPLPDTLSWHIYLQEQHRDVAEGISIGDRVFFYEFKGTKIKVQPALPIGSMGIVCVGIVVGEPFKTDPSEGMVEYIDGETKYWSWVVPVGHRSFRGFVPRKEIVNVLGYKDNYFFRGFNGGRGIKMISSGEGEQLNDLFVKGQPLQPSRFRGR